MKVYVAFREESDVKLVDKSLTTVKKRLKEHPSTTWLVAFYQLPSGAANVCAAIENILGFEAESAQHYSVSPKGRVSMVDPP